MISRRYALRGAEFFSRSTGSPFGDFSVSIPTQVITATGIRSEVHAGSSALPAVLRKLAARDLPGKGQVDAYLRHMARRNCKGKSLYGALNALELFLGFIQEGGKRCLGEITKSDVEGFIEHEQDRGLKITTIRTRLVYIQTFLRYVIDEGVVSPEVFGRRIRLQLPESLPRAMEPEDVKQFLSVVDHTRDRAMLLVLLRTGMRIGELLATKVGDIHLKERRIEIYEGEKNRLGRVVYLSDDAVSALRAWYAERDCEKEYLIYGRDGRGLGYSTARLRFMKYLTKAGLTAKGYTVHSLRHTFASELLNAGMRLECLQVLLGHHSIEETRRYARLTDKTREEEYFTAMSIIERGEIDGHYRRDRELAASLEEEELFAEYR